MSALDADALLFDLGGVLLEIDWQRAFTDWAIVAGMPAQEIASRFAFDEAYAAHERGELSATDYFASLRRSLGINLADAAFLAGWNAIIVREIPGVRALLAAAARRRPVYLFSNTGQAHRAHWQPQYRDLLRPFSEVFLSCEIGLRKPDPEAFALVVGRIGMPAERILLLDDTTQNVAGARAAGLRAFQVRSPGEIAAALGLSG